MGKKSLIKSTSKKKTGDTDPAKEKTPSAAEQSAKPAGVKETAPKKAAAKKATPKKTAAKKSAAKPAAKKKTAAAAKKAAAKKAAAKKRAAKPAAKKKTPAAAKKAAPKKVAAKKSAAKPVAKKKASAAAKKAAPSVEEKTTPAPKPAAPKATDAPKPEAVKPELTTTAPPLQKETPPPEKTAPAAPVQAAATQDAVKGPSEPKTPSTKAPQITQPPERPTPSPEDQVEVAYEKPVTIGKPPSEPMNPVLKYGAIGLAFLIFLVIAASATNSRRYYIKKRPLDIEISKGEFSPIGKKPLVKISGVAMPETTKAVYSRNDAYPMIFQYYLNHADALLENTTAPDYDAIKVLIKRAQKYAVTPELAKQANRRLAAIELHHLFYKASVTAEKGTVEAFDEGLGFLAQAKKLSLDESQQAMVDHKIAEMKDARARIEVEKTVKEIMTTPPVEEKTTTSH